MNNDNNNEVVYFTCDKKLKSDFYKLAKEKNLSPGGLLKAFMKKAVQNPDEFKRNPKPEKADDN